MNTDPIMWNLDQGILFCRTLEILLRDNKSYHCALGGSVLVDGISRKDLDVFIYPHHSEGKIDPEDLFRALYPLELVGWKKAEFARYEEDEKQVYTATYSGKRIDFFLLA